MEKIELSLKKSNGFLKTNSPEDLIIYVTRDNQTFSTSNTVGEARFITLLDFENTFPPLIHEYIHIHQRRFKELWFQEGMAEYLTLLIIEKYGLTNLNDFTYLKYVNAWKYTNTNVHWKLREELAFIDDLKRKYSIDSIKSILRFDQELNYKDLENMNEFYRLSASFCEYLFKELGDDTIKEINDIAMMKRKSSAIEICSDLGINLKSYYHLWLDSLFANQ